MIKLKSIIEIINDDIVNVYNETTKESIKNYNIPPCTSHRFDNLEVKEIYSWLDEIYITVSEPEIIKLFTVYKIESKVGPNCKTPLANFKTKADAQSYIEVFGNTNEKYLIEESEFINE